MPREVFTSKSLNSEIFLRAAGGPIVPIRKDKGRIPGLAPVDEGEISLGEVVALKVPGAILLGNDLGTLSCVEERTEAKSMVSITVRVVNGVQRGLTPDANGGVY
jgi:hypothetical protein